MILFYHLSTSFQTGQRLLRALSAYIMSRRIFCIGLPAIPGSDKHWLDLLLIACQKQRGKISCKVKHSPVKKFRANTASSISPSFVNALQCSFASKLSVRGKDSGFHQCMWWTMLPKPSSYSLPCSLLIIQCVVSCLISCTPLMPGSQAEFLISSWAF